MNRDDIARQLRENVCRWFEGRTCHPEVAEIDKLVLSARRLLLSNYFEATGGPDLTAEVDILHKILAGQIHRAMFKRCIDKDATEESRKKACEKADAVIDAFPSIQEMVYEDVIETYNSDPAASGYDEVILTYPGLFALMVYRLAHVVHCLDIPLLPRMMTEYAHQITGIDLHPGALIGRSIMIDHGTGIVVGETAVVGNHVKIYQGVTLGALYFPRDDAGSVLRSTRRHPTVEDHVVLYANATVLGGDTVIGHHSVIGSNAWVTDSVPPFSKVIYEAEVTVRTQKV